MKYFLDAFRKWNDFNGRATIKEFWGFFGIHIVLYLSLRFISANLLTSEYYSDIFIVFPIIGMIYAIISIIPTISITIRRLHDINKCGWWILLFFIPLVGWFILLIFLLMSSQEKGNRWIDTKENLYDYSKYSTLVLQNIKFVIFGVGFITSVLLGFYFKNYIGHFPSSVDSKWKADIFINRVTSKSDFFDLGKRFTYSWSAFLMGIILTIAFYVLYTKVNFKPIKDKIKGELKPYLKDEEKSNKGKTTNKAEDTINKISDENSEIKKDINSLEKIANEGDAKTQYDLGECYHRGIGVDISYEKAIKWWRKSAIQNNADAQYSMGLCYYKGEGVDKNTTIVKYWLEKACNNGNNEACKLLKNLP